MTADKYTANDRYRLARFGYDLYQQGDTRRASCVFEGLLELDSSDAYAARGLAACALMEGDAARAVEIMDALVARNPADMAARGRRVEGLIAGRRNDEAASELQLLRGRVNTAVYQRLELLWKAATSSGTTAITSA